MNNKYENRQEDFWAVKLFHNLPHFNLTLDLIDSTFKPNSSRYRESLLLWAAIPVLLLVLTLILFLVYFCYRCCQTKEESRPNAAHELPCLKWSLGITSFIVCGLLALTLFANEDARKGLWRAESSLNHIDHLLGLMRNDIDDFEATRHRFKSLTNKLPTGRSDTNSDSRHIPNLINEQKYSANRNLTECSKKLEKIGNEYDDRRLNKHLSNFRDLQFIRWLTTLALMCWTIVLCISLLIGIGMSSKCILLIFCSLSTFTIVIFWAFIGMQLAYAIGTSDFCIKPTVFIQFVFPQIHMEHIRHFTEFRCHRQLKRFHNANTMQHCSNTLADVDHFYDSVSNYYNNYQTKKDLDEIRTNLRSYVNGIKTCLDCRPFKREYDEGMDAICKLNLTSTFILIVSSLIIVFMLTAMVIISSHAWRHFQKPDKVITEPHKGNGNGVMYEELMLYLPRKGYASVDDDDPFLPRETDSQLRNSIDDNIGNPVHLSATSTDNSIDYTSTPKYSAYRAGSNTLPNGGRHYHHNPTQEYKKPTINSMTVDATLPRSHVHYTNRL